MEAEDRVRLWHMLDAAEEALTFAQDRTREDLEHDRMLILALVKEIEIIGEAAYQTKVSTRLEFQQLPWEDIIGMRHRLVHAYFEINLDILWKTIKDELPNLVEKLKTVLENNPL